MVPMSGGHRRAHPCTQRMFPTRTQPTILDSDIWVRPFRPLEVPALSSMLSLSWVGAFFLNWSPYPMGSLTETLCCLSNSLSLDFVHMTPTGCVCSLVLRGEVYFCTRSVLRARLSAVPTQTFSAQKWTPLDVSSEDPCAHLHGLTVK